MLAHSNSVVASPISPHWANIQSGIIEFYSSSVVAFPIEFYSSSVLAFPISPHWANIQSGIMGFYSNSVVAFPISSRWANIQLGIIEFLHSVDLLVCSLGEYSMKV
jgi:hypothetical protein